VGPITLFDKSFLQSLSVDESLWFDNFFLTNICPLFYVETLADLEKSVREGRTPEQEVGIIASKFPEMHGTPCGHHRRSIVGNLLGYPVPMTGQIPIAGGRTFRAGNQAGIVFDHPPETEAFTRWQRGDFLDVERLYARAWRDGLQAAKVGLIADGFRALGVTGQTFKTLTEVKAAADIIVAQPKARVRHMKRALNILGVPPNAHDPILQVWRARGCPPLAEYAPYASHVLTVDLFFHLAAAANLISVKDRVDIAYLYYLPFCMVFVSSDHVHQRCVPLFARKNQMFVWGPELKADLQRINEHYSKLPAATKELGAIKFAATPPVEGDLLVTRIWNSFRKREHGGSAETEANGVQPQHAALIEELRRVTHEPERGTTDIGPFPDNPDMLAITRSVHRRKGTWWQVPKDID
jgi:hypothetical protein